MLCRDGKVERIEIGAGGLENRDSDAVDAGVAWI